MKQKDILIILILIFSFTVAWIGFSIYHAIRSSTISKSTNQDILPINPTFDIQTIDKLKQRQKIDPSFDLEAIKPTEAPILPTEIIPQPSSSAEAELTP